MANKKPIEKPFDEALHGMFYDLFRRAGIPLHINQVDAVRGVTTQIADLFEKEAKKQALKVATASIKSFNKMEDRLRAVEARVEEVGKAPNVLLDSSSADLTNVE